MRPLATAVAALIVCSSGLAGVLPQARGSVRFTVRDAIEFERVIRQSDDLHAFVQANPVNSTALRSPDGAHVVLQTRKGLVEGNALQDTLWIISQRHIEGLLSGEAVQLSTKPEILHVRTATREADVIARLQWLGSNAIGFIAADTEGVRQAFAVEIADGKVIQLTHSPTHVTSFATAADTVLYYSQMAEPAGLVTSITRSDVDIGGVIDPETYSSLFPRVGLFIKAADGVTRAVDSPEIRLLPQFQALWISPNGRYAIAMQPAISWPFYWEEYQSPDMQAFQYSRERATNDGTALELLNRVQYRLIDIQEATSSPLIDAPSGQLSLNSTPVRVFWSSDSTSVVLSSTFLPLSGTEGAERRHRALHPAITEVQIASRQVTSILWEPAARPDSRGGRETVENPIVAVDFRDDKLFVHVAKQTGSTLAPINPDNIAVSVFHKAKGNWRRSKTNGDHWVTGGVSIDVRQGLNERPVVIATGGRCECSRTLLDPNPSADRFSFGRAKVIEWNDKNEISWQGALTFPPDYNRNVRYPLVIQTHGFHPDEFLVDGPQGTTTAFAAQPLANAGFIVAQVEENARAETHDVREPTYYAEGMRSLIEKLNKEAMIDASRVAAIGWSISGSYVMRLMEEHAGILAAAVISDAAQFGYVPYLISVNLPLSMREAFDRFAGIQPADRAAQIIAQDRLHQWAPMAPPIRLEAIRPGAVVGMWETYAVLRFANRPVDFVYYPGGSHSLQKPAERLSSQQGTVDWLRFWLQHTEDQDATKHHQYELWRSMRTLE